MQKNRLGVYIAIAIGVAVAIGIFSSNSKEDTNEIYHITLADPALYNDGIFTDSFKISSGDYQFRFVSNGDSPKILSISLKGGSFSFSEDFELLGTPHETGISVYYTWDYLGKKGIEVANDQELTITIDPHGNVLGAVSVDLLSLQ